MSPSNIRTLAHAQTALRTIETQDSRAIRNQVLDVLSAVAGAEFGMFCSLDRHAGVSFLVNLLATTRDADATFREFEGHPAFPTPFDPLDPPPGQVNRFIGCLSMHRTMQQDHALKTQIYGPLGVGDELRAYVYDGSRFVGRIALMHSQANLSNRTMISLVNRLMPEVQALLTHADRLERAELDPPPIFVVHATGRLDFATQSGEAWLTPARRESIGDLARRADSGTLAEIPHLIDGARATVVRIYGAVVAYLITLEAIHAPELAPDHLLTLRQREIAEYVICGATAREISKTLSIGFDTVRDHIKEIYSRLGLASRLELANALKR